MSRSFSLTGLPKEAKDFINSKQLKLIGTHEFKEFFYSDGYSFKVYQGDDGSLYEEFEAGCPWDGGPILFLGLKNKTTGEILFSWTPSQMGFSEDITLTPEQESKIKEITKVFVTDENTPSIQGPATLYMALEGEKCFFWQDLISEYPNYRYLEMDLSSADFISLRDYLTQQGFHICEMDNFSQWKLEWDRYIQGSKI